MGEHDRHLGHRGKFAAEFLEHVLEHGHEERDERHHHADREGHHERRVDHRRFDLAAQRGVLLQLVGDAHERVLEHTAGLPRLCHRDEQRVEDLRVARHRVAQRQTRLDVLADGDDRLGQVLALGLLLEHVQRAQDAHAGGDHRRELPREDRQVVGLDPLHERELDLARGVLVGDVEDDQPALLELVGDRLLGVGLDLAAGLAAGEVDCLEDVRAHGDPTRLPYAAASVFAPSRRLSSSGVEERASASFWVILPWRTSVDSEVSIVCMPAAELVCSTE